MRKIFLTVVMALLLASPAFADVAFVNGGFEDGNFNNWTINASGGGPAVTMPGTGVTDYSVANSWWPTGGNHIATVVTSGTDPNVGINRTYNGSSAGRVGDDRFWGGEPYQYSSIEQSTVVTGTTAGHLYFAWAAVLETSYHDYYSTPYFEVKVTNDTQNTGIYDVKKYEGDGGFWTTLGAWQYSTGNNVIYPGWYIEDIDLTGKAAIGDSLTLEAIARDCIPTGHAMYVYLDGFGGAPPPPPGVIPEPCTMLLFGTGIAGAAGILRKKIKKN